MAVGYRSDIRVATLALQGPSRDGVRKQDMDSNEGQKSYQIVTDMLNQLATQDEAYVRIGIRT